MDLGVAVTPGAGRNGTAGARTGFGSRLRKTLDQQATWTVGFAVRFAGFNRANQVAAWLDAGVEQCSLRINLDGTLTVSRSGTPLTGGTSAEAVSTGTYNYVEWSLTVGTSISADTCVVRVNGVQWISAAAGQSTRSTANSTANGFTLGPNDGGDGTPYDYDDLYVCDTAGSANTTFLGDVMISALYPDGAGNSSGWTPLSGANWQNVDETLANGDTDYVSTGTATAVDLYTYTNLTGTPSSIKGVQWVAQVRKTDASSYLLSRVYRVSGTNYVGTAQFSPNTTYRMVTDPADVNPGTSAAWTKADIDALEAGIKLVSVT